MVSFSGRKHSIRVDGKLFQMCVCEYVCACMFIRVELHVTGSQHEGKCGLIETL